MSVSVWEIDRRAILTRLKRWAKKLGQDENVLAVVLFGSLARGDYTAASDADIVIILRDSPLRFDERIPPLMPSGVGISVDLFPYTLDEARRAIAERWGLVSVALKEGTPLFRREARLEGLQSEVEGEHSHGGE